MEALLDSIRIAASDGATDEERRRGATACRALAQALDGDLCGSTLAALAASPAAGAASPELRAAPAAALASGPFAGMTADQVLDLAIAKLRAAVGDGPAAPPLGQPFTVPLVPVPRYP